MQMIQLFTPVPPQQAIYDLQHGFDSIPKSLTELKLVLNANKTKFMLFSRSRNIAPEDLCICILKGAQIEQVPHYKYFDIWIDDNLSFKRHIGKTDKKKKRIIIGFFYGNKSCITLESRWQIVQAILIMVIDMHVAASILKPLFETQSIIQQCVFITAFCVGLLVGNL